MTAKVLQTVQILETEPAIATAASQQRWSFAGGARTIAAPVRSSRISGAVLALPIMTRAVDAACQGLYRSVVYAAIPCGDARAREVAVI